MSTPIVSTGTIRIDVERCKGCELCIPACPVDVLSMSEAPAHPHHRARDSFVTVGGVVQPGPAPRFSATPCAIPTPPEPAGASTTAALAAWGIAPARIEELARARAIGTQR